MEIKCIITDDEPLARKGLREYVQKIDFLKLIGECEDALQLNAMMKSTQPDLLFLDIEMPQLSGLDFLATLSHPPKVIITSAYEKYAVKGYEFDVADYLLKPISFERFFKSVNKIHDQLEKEQKKEEQSYIFVKSDKQLKKIFLDNILFLESMENYVVIHTATSKETVYSTLKNMLESLTDKRFMQTHRSFIVNINHVQSIDGNQLVIGENKIPVARNLQEAVFSTILKNRLISRI